MDQLQMAAACMKLLCCSADVSRAMVSAGMFIAFDVCSAAREEQNYKHATCFLVFPRNFFAKHRSLGDYSTQFTKLLQV
jgi:hypothetical protein